MAELKIRIAADTLNATEGITKVTDSLTSLGNKVIQTGEGFDQYTQGLERDLQKIWDVNPEYKALFKQQQLLAKETSKMSIAFGSQSKEATTLNDALQYVNQSISDYEKKSTETASAQKDLVKSVDESATSFENLGKKVGLVKLAEIAKNILKFQLIMMPIQKTIRFVTQTITESIQVAAEAEQIFNKLTTVFENNAAAMGKAQEMAQSYGTSISTMASSLSTVGDLLQAQGMGRSESLELAAQWTEAFSDIIAFKDINMSVEEFAQNFMSGAAGNLRNFRTFGSIVKESAVNAELAKRGLSDLSGEELELEKMVIRATMALDQQANAMGATQSEWDTALSVTRRLNEQWKEYKENLGTTINEVLTPLKGWLSDILSIANDVTAAAKEINGGEFTIKVEQADSEELTKTLKTLFDLVSGRENDDDKISTSGSGLWEKIKQALFISTLAQTGHWVESTNMAKEYNTLSSKDISDIMLATGATLEQVKEAFEDTAYAIEDGAWEEAQNIVDLTKARIEREDARTKQLQALEESNLKDYRDTLAAMFTNTGEMSSWLAGNSFVDHNSAEYVLGRNKGTAEENVGASTGEIAAILDYLRTTMPKLETDKASMEAQLTKAQTDFDANAVIDDGTVYGNGNGWSQEEARQQYNLIQKLSKQIKAIEATTESWSAMEGELSDTLAQLYAKEAKDSAKSAVDSSTQELAASNAYNAKKAELEAQYTDGMSYMVDILMQEYEYGLKYAEMLKTLTEAGYSAIDATALLASYKDEYTKALAAAKKDAEGTANAEKAASDKEAKASALKRNREWSEYLKGLRYTAASKGPYGEVEDWYRETEQAGRERLNEEVENGDITMMQYFDNIKELNSVLESEVEVRKRLVEEQQLQASMDTVFGAFGDIGGIVSTIASWTAEDFAQFASIGKEGGLAGGLEGFASSAIGGDIITMLAQIVSQLEVVQAISSFIGDYIVPVLDSFLEPLMPLIQTIGGLMQSLIQGILVPLFPIFVEVAALLTLIVGTVKAGIDFIINSIKWVIGNLAKSILQALDKIIWGDQSSWYGEDTWVGQWSSVNPFDEFNKTMSETLDAVKTIRGTTLDIEKNTSDDVDLSFLNELLAAGIIDEAGYNERAKVKQAGLHWDTVTPGQAKYIDYDYSRGNVSVRGGSVTINIDGGDTEEVRKAVMSALKQSGIGVSGTGYQEYA